MRDVLCCNDSNALLTPKNSTQKLYNPKLKQGAKIKPTTPMLLLSTNASSLESGECLSDELCTQELEALELERAK